MKSPAREPPRISAATRLRTLIEAAEADSVGRDEMILRLTFSDVSQLKRDASLDVADISFAGGVMRFLGVRIQQGGVVESVLDRTR
jgi:hypothetical protein